MGIKELLHPEPVVVSVKLPRPMKGLELTDKLLTSNDGYFRIKRTTYDLEYRFGAPDTYDVESGKIVEQKRYCDNIHIGRKYLSHSLKNLKWGLLPFPPLLWGLVAFCVGSIDVGTTLVQDKQYSNLEFHACEWTYNTPEFKNEFMPKFEDLLSRFYESLRER